MLWNLQWRAAWSFLQERNEPEKEETLNKGNKQKISDRKFEGEKNQQSWGFSVNNIKGFEQSLNFVDLAEQKFIQITLRL